jgi:hypothetical protein
LCSVTNPKTRSLLSRPISTTNHRIAPWFASPIALRPLVGGCTNHVQITKKFPKLQQAVFNSVCRRYLIFLIYYYHHHLLLSLFIIFYYYLKFIIIICNNFQIPHSLHCFCLGVFLFTLFFIIEASIGCISFTHHSSIL